MRMSFLTLRGRSRNCGLIVFCGCQRNDALESKDSGFGFMLNPDVYSTNLCGFKLAELGTHEFGNKVSVNQRHLSRFEVASKELHR